MRIIELSRGKQTLVDDGDYDRLMDYKWYAMFNGHYFFAYTRTLDQYMHRFILRAPRYTEVDHINLDTLDNQRSNLRLATSSQNKANQPKRRQGTSKYKGVSWAKKPGKWVAYACCEGANTNLGYYHNEEDAARAYDKAAVELFGEFAYRNFP